METLPKKVEYHFGVVDHIIFAAMLLGSALTGVYFACRYKIFSAKSKESLKDYLTGNRLLTPVPVALSLVASYISGVTMLGTPAEIYNYGAQYWLVIFAMILSGVAVSFVYLPVFYHLQVCSSYEYLELRFSKTLRTFASFFFVFDEVMFLPMLIYIPSLAYNQVTGINLHIISVVVMTTCVFYTIMGGIRAVVYTDAWQTAVMFISDIVVVGIGIYAVGGFGVIIDKSVEGHRIQNLNFNPSMYERYTVWSVLLGGFTYWTCFNAVNQTMVQRYLTLKSLGKSQLSVAIFTFGVVFFISLCCFAGLLIYATYHDCDPLKSNRVAKGDQMLALFVAETAGHLPGVSGLFIAGVFGAALSSLSVVLNSTSIVLLEDFLSRSKRLHFTERTAGITSKVIIVILGVIACSLVFVLEKMGSIFEVATTLSSISAGTMFGVFSLGMLVPWANTKGAIAAATFGFIFSFFVAFGNQYVGSHGLSVPRALPVSLERCEAIYNITVDVNATETVYPDDSHIFPLWRLSYLWTSVLSFLSTFITGVAVSLCTGRTDLATMDPDLISPVSRWMLPEQSKFMKGKAVEKIKSTRLLQGLSEARAAQLMRLKELNQEDND